MSHASSRPAAHPSTVHYSAPSRARLLALGATGAAALAALAVGAPAPARAATGTSSGRAALAVPAATGGLALWGASSMAGGHGHQGTPLPTYIHDILTLAVNPRPVRNHAHGGTNSGYALLASGAETPVVTLPAGYTGGRVTVQVATASWAVAGTSIPGSIGGLRGVLSSPALNVWQFERTGGSGGSGPFLSDWRAEARDSRHIIWTGKNNITQTDLVQAHIEAVRATARNPADDVLVLGQWATSSDRNGTGTNGALTTLNRRQKQAYGTRFLDVQELLTTPWGLSSHPVRGLNLLDRADVRGDIAAGIVPRALQGSDGVHLNGWGNLVVAAAIITRMGDIGWL
ncbi:hypothetical protein [Brachybacterium huguangmaarense]